MEGVHPMSVAQRGAWALALAFGVVAISGRVAGADCTDSDCPTAAIVEPVRAMVASACDCAGVKSHKKYLRCTKQVLKSAARSGLMPAECKKTIRRCEARSTCGISGAMVCCEPKTDGTIKAQVTKKESRCRGKVCTGALATADACRPDGTCAEPRNAGLRSFRSVQQVFTTSCALSSCHSTLARQGGLVLDTEGISYNNLVGHPSTHPKAREQGLLRVQPGDPENSFLIQKLRARGPGEIGDPMPQSGGPLPDPVIDMIADWIERGAKTTDQECPPRPDGRGTVCDDRPVDTGDYVWAPEPALEVPPPAQGIQLYTPPRDVAPGTEWETCYAFPLDTAALKTQLGLTAENPVIKNQTYRTYKGSHHLLLYMYVGTDPDGWAQGYFPCVAANCINAADCPQDADGIDDPNDDTCDDNAFVLPIGGTQVAGTRYEVKYPEGVGVPVLGANMVLIINPHFTNPFQPAQTVYGEGWLNLEFYKKDELKAQLDGIFVINFGDLFVEPYKTRTISRIWKPRKILGGSPTDAAIFQLFGHMHKRATEFQIDYVRGGHCSGNVNRLCGRDADCNGGQTCIKSAGAEDTTIYYTTAWDQAPIVDYPEPYFRVQHDEGLRWTCTHTNGIEGDPARPPKKCEAGCGACGWDDATRTCIFQRGVQQNFASLDPGTQTCKYTYGVPRASDDPCVFSEGEPMPLVFGQLADDDMCNMFGYFINQADLPKIDLQ